MDLITSHSNSKIKLARSLRQRKARQEGGLFLVEGIWHIGQAVQAGARFETILYSPEQLHSAYAQALISDQLQRGVACLAVSGEVFASLAEKDNPQGILAIVHQPTHRLADLQPASQPWLVALVDPQDPGNVGAILRTIDAVGASGLALLSSGQSPASGGRTSAIGGLVDPYHPTCVRASMGAIFWLPIVSDSFDGFVDWGKVNGYDIIGTSARGGIDFREITGYARRRVLVLGSEREGLNPDQIERCDLLVRLPMLGKTSSLNLAVAAGVLLYDQLSKGFSSEAP